MIILLKTKVIGFSRSGDIYIFLMPKQKLEPVGIEHQLRELYDKLNICLFAEKIETQLQEFLNSGVMSTEDIEMIQEQAKSKLGKTGFPSRELRDSVKKLSEFNIKGSKKRIFGK